MYKRVENVPNYCVYASCRGSVNMKLFLYFGSARGTGSSFEIRSRHKHGSLWVMPDIDCKLDCVASNKAGGKVESKSVLPFAIRRPFKRTMLTKYQTSK